MFCIVESQFPSLRRLCTELAGTGELELAVPVKMLGGWQGETDSIRLPPIARSAAQDPPDLSVVRLSGALETVSHDVCEPIPVRCDTV